MQIYHDVKEREPVGREGDNSPFKESGELDKPVSSFKYLVVAKEALGYTPEQTLDTSYALIEGMLQEYAYMMKERNRKSQPDEEGGENYKWVEVIDFETGKPKKIKRYNEQI